MSQAETIRSNAGTNAGARLGLRFALSYALIAALLFAVYCFPYAESGISERCFALYLSGYARLAGALLRVFEPSIVVSGSQIIGRRSLEIIKSCDAIEVNILFAAAVLALPAVWSRRLAALAGGVALLTFTNVVRICSLYYAGLASASLFDFLHLELWPLLLVALAAVQFVLWARWAQRTPEGARRAER